MQTETEHKPVVSTPLAMSATAQSKTETAHPQIDRAVDELRAHAREFARLPVADKRKLVESCIGTTMAVAEAWVAAGCQAKGLQPGTPQEGEEWLAGVAPTVRNLRLLGQSLREIEKNGKPRLGTAVHARDDGRVEIDVFPASFADKVFFTGFTAKVRLLPGWDEKRARENQASFYAKKDPEGGVSLVLGAGNVSSIPAMDVLYKMFVDGNVCLLKMNPVNEWVGPHLERAFAPLVDKGYLRIVYGGGDVGAYLSSHVGVDDIHITGSDRTHDLIVWGPPGPDREARKAANQPLNPRPITSELGNVSPVVVVPGHFSDAELAFQAKSVASMVTNNASFNCNAAKMLVVGKGWPQREKFRELVGKALAEVAPRNAYYPGAHDRYKTLTDGRKVEKIGAAGDGQLAWTLIPDVDSSKPDEPLFHTEPFCAILSETALDAKDPVEFLATATQFCNDRLWGTLNACIIIPPSVEKTPEGAKALDQAITDLRYGSVAINHWPALCYALVVTPWGGHPSATLDNIQSGLGWVHNTFMLEGIEKTILRGPIKVAPKPAWFYDNNVAHKMGPKLSRFEASPSLFKFPGMIFTALGG